MTKEKKPELALECEGMGPKKRQEKVIFLCIHRKATIKI